jgi:hypothetical protein
VFAGYALATDASIDSLELAIAGDFTSIDTRATNLETALSAEILATNTDVTSLETLVSNEIDDMTQYVGGNFAALNTADFIETARAIAAEGSLSTDILAEYNRATNAENDISMNVFIETTRAIAAEGSLETSIGSLETAHDARLDSLEGYIMEDAQELTEKFVGAGYSYTLSNSVQDGNKYLVKAYVNGVFVEVTSVVGAIATVSTSYAIDGDDNVTFTYQF